ncbi:hypothetical protein [Spongiactinospora rosea]|nr:hypothetical protein [Spongiactinospora rosea]
MIAKRWGKRPFHRPRAALAGRFEVLIALGRVAAQGAAGSAECVSC